MIRDSRTSDRPGSQIRRRGVSIPAPGEEGVPFFSSYAVPRLSSRGAIRAHGWPGLLFDADRIATSSSGFTLVEILVASTVFVVVLAITLSAMGNATSIWRNSAAKIEAFQGARSAFALITRNLSQATLNAYLDYDDANNPTRYLRKSDLRFVCGPAGGSFPGTPDTGQAAFFQLPGGYTDLRTNFGGMETLLNTCGYFVAFSEDPLLPWHLRPPYATGSGKYRYRLMQLLVPTEKNMIFTASGATDYSWFAPAAASSNFGSTVLPVADNVIALIIEPLDPKKGGDPLAPQYAYNTAISGFQADGTQLATANQLPPTVRLTMVAIDEASALRLENGSSPPSVIVTALAGRFKDATNFDDNLKALEGDLAKAKIQYRVFTSLVPIRESKWTK